MLYHPSVTGGTLANASNGHDIMVPLGTQFRCKTLPHAELYFSCENQHNSNYLTEFL